MNSKHADRRTLRRTACTLGAVAMLLAGLGPSAPAQAACPNEAIRASQTSEELPKGTVELPACMALEMVSPAKKFGQLTFAPSFARSGDRVLFRSLAALGDTQGMQNGLSGDHYLSSRGSSSWSTAPTSPQSDAQIFTGSNHGGPYAFSTAMDRWVLFGTTQAEDHLAALRFFRGGLDGSFLPLSDLLVPNDDSGRSTLSSVVATSPWRGTSRDLRTTLFSPFLASTTFLPGDPGEGTAAEDVPGDRNEYIVSGEPGGETSLELLARDKEGVVHGGFCGTHIGGGVWAGGSGRLDQGAISGDGSRIYFSTRPDQPGEVAGIWPTCDTDNPLRIMVRSMSPEGPVIEELVPGGPAEPSDLYQGASADGSKVFFTTARSLVPGDNDTGTECSADPGDSDGCDLYLFDSELPEGERLIQVSAGEAGTPTPGEGANVLSSITAVSNDGSHAYFVAEGVLAANTNSEGVTAIEGLPNLYLYDEGVLTFIGALSEDDKDVLWGVERSFGGGAYAAPLWEGGEEGGDGHILLLASSAPLSGDGDGDKRDIFRYDAEKGTLQCVSCMELGTPADVSVNPYDGKAPAPNFTEPGRWVSEDGNTVAFATAEPLVSGDEDGAENPYVWAEGQLARLPTEVKGERLMLPVVSASGNQVAFSTENALLPAFDGDTARDVYVARANGGFPNPKPPSICDPLLEGACQGPPSSAPAIPLAASSAFSGPGDKKSTTRCTKPRVRRKGRCVKPGKRAAKRRAGRNGRGGRR